MRISQLKLFVVHCASLELLNMLCINSKIINGFKNIKLNFMTNIG